MVMSAAADIVAPSLPGAGLLNSKVLVLNRSYLPVHVTSVKRAFALLYQGVAKAVDEQYHTFDLVVALSNRGTEPAVSRATDFNSSLGCANRVEGGSVASEMMGAVAVDARSTGMAGG